MERTQEARVPSSSRAIPFLPQVVTLFTISFFHLPLSFLFFFFFFHFTLVPIFSINLRFHRLLGYYHQVITLHSFVRPIFAKMAAWTRFKLLLAMVTTLVTMVAASAGMFHG
jgi:hypothetical protein